MGRERSSPVSCILVSNEDGADPTDDPRSLCKSQVEMTYHALARLFFFLSVLEERDNICTHIIGAIALSKVNNNRERSTKMIRLAVSV